MKTIRPPFETHDQIAKYCVLNQKDWGIVFQFKIYKTETNLKIYTSFTTL